jgi:hypothetical protein
MSVFVDVSYIHTYSRIYMYVCMYVYVCMYIAGTFTAYRIYT